MEMFRFAPHFDRFCLQGTWSTFFRCQFWVPKDFPQILFWITVVTWKHSKHLCITTHRPHHHWSQLGFFEDGFDDNGWGCAYRSLQTCVSWYRLQHYSEELVPSIPEIQRLLKRIDEVPMVRWLEYEGRGLGFMTFEGC